MLLLLPPSESKRDGGSGRLDLDALGFPSLKPQRRTAIAALGRLSRSVSASAAALGLGPAQRFEIERNRALRSSPALPALDRYSGVLYDALDARTLTADERSFAAEHVAIHSALFGLLGASDAIPAYRLSHDSRLLGLRLRQLWREPITSALDGRAGLILDLRSEAYAALGPVPRRDGAATVRVVSRGPDGRKRALNHFNKRGKGELARALIRSGRDHASLASLLDWAADRGIELDAAGEGVVELVVAGQLGTRMSEDQGEASWITRM